MFTERCQAWHQWLRDYLGGITKSAAECGGVSAAVMLDLEGILVNSFGTACSFFPVEARNGSTRPITELVILLGGPNGIENDYAEKMVETMKEGTDLGVIKIRLPGGLQHSHVALADILMLHDRGYLLSVLQDIRTVGPDEYQKRRKKMEGILRVFGASPLPRARKEALLDKFVVEMREACAQEGIEKDSFDIDILLNQETEDASRIDGYLAAVRRYLRRAKNWTAKFADLQGEFRGLQRNILKASGVFAIWSDKRAREWVTMKTPAETEEGGGGPYTEETWKKILEREEEEEVAEGKWPVE